MIALDTSVIVAAFGGWHEHHTPAREAVTPASRLPAHAALEAYSVITRLPEPFRAEPSVVVEFLRRAFPPSRLALPAEQQAELPERLFAAGLSGGAVYDGVIALTALAAGAELVTLDRRALETYRRCGATVTLLAP